MVPVLNYLKLGFFIAIVAAVSFFFIDYKRLQHKTEELNLEVSKYSDIVEQQKKHIDDLDKAYNQIDELKKDIDTQIQKSNKNLQRVQDLVLKHDLAYLANKKPGLIQKKINNATSEVMRCFELVTGNEVKENEQNSQCPDLTDN